MMTLIAPHRKISRFVREGDIERAASQAAGMLTLIKKFEHCVALAHPQVDESDPLRMYVTREGLVVINPVIILPGRDIVESHEGCMTFYGRPTIIKQRRRIVTLSFQEIQGTTLTDGREMTLKGFPAFVAQHEIDHLDGVYCYDV